MFALFSFLLAALLPAQPLGTPSADPVAFVNVNVIPMGTMEVLYNHTVVVQEGRITAVGPAGEVEIPSGAVQVDGTGRYLLPGLAEMHGHIPPPNAPPEYIDAVLFLYLAGGITTVRGMLGWPGQLELRDQANQGEVVSPHLYLAGPSFNGNSIDSPEQAREKVEEQHAAGWNLLKIHPGLTRAEYDAMAETANRLGIRFGGHIPADVGLAHALEMGQETIDHVDGYIAYFGGDQKRLTDAQLAEAVAMTKTANAWVVPTMALWETLYCTADLEEMEGYDELKYAPRNQVASWSAAFEQRCNNPQNDPAVAQRIIDNRNRLLKALSDGGARILMGTDAPQQFSVPGFSLHRELDVMVAAGMSPYEILKSGTENVGAYFAHIDAFGTVAVGQRADLMLVRANPLEDIRHLRDPEGVMVEGRWYDRAFLDTRLAEIAALFAE